MPKMKSNSGAKKRIRRTGTGKLKREKAYRSHILTKMSPKRKRSLKKAGLVHRADKKRVNRMLP